MRADVDDLRVVLPTALPRRARGIRRRHDRVTEVVPRAGGPVAGGQPDGRPTAGQVRVRRGVVHQVVPVVEHDIRCPHVPGGGQPRRRRRERVTDVAPVHEVQGSEGRDVVDDRVALRVLLVLGQRVSGAVQVPVPITSGPRAQHGRVGAAGRRSAAGQRQSQRIAVGRCGDLPATRHDGGRGVSRDESWHRRAPRTRRCRASSEDATWAGNRSGCGGCHRGSPRQAGRAPGLHTSHRF